MTQIEKERNFIKANRLNIELCTEVNKNTKTESNGSYHHMEINILPLLADIIARNSITHKKIDEVYYGRYIENYKLTKKYSSSIRESIEDSSLEREIYYRKMLAIMYNAFYDNTDDILSIIKTGWKRLYKEYSYNDNDVYNPQALLSSYCYTTGADRQDTALIIHYLDKNTHKEIEDKYIRDRWTAELRKITLASTIIKERFYTNEIIDFDKNTSSTLKEYGSSIKHITEKIDKCTTFGELFEDFYINEFMYDDLNNMLTKASKNRKKIKEFPDMTPMQLDALSDENEMILQKVSSKLVAGENFTDDVMFYACSAMITITNLFNLKGFDIKKLIGSAPIDTKMKRRIKSLILLNSLDEVEELTATSYMYMLIISILLETLRNTKESSYNLSLLLPASESKKKDDEIIKLQEENAKLANDLKLVKKEIHANEVSKNDFKALQEQIRALQEDNKELNRQVDTLNTLNNIYKEECANLIELNSDTPAAEMKLSDADIEEMTHAITEEPVLIVAGHPNWQRALKEKFPKWKYIDTDDIHFNTSLLDHYKYIVINTSMCSHSIFYKVINRKSAHNNILYVSGTNIEGSISNISKFITKKEGGSN